MRALLDKEQALRPWQRAPQWRWNIALAGRAAVDGLSALRIDDSLYEAASFYRHVCAQRNAFMYRNRVYPEMSLAFSVWAGAGARSSLEDGAGKGGWRALIDALILAGLPFDQFASALKVDLPADAVKAYHDVFFDVGAYLESEPAVFINVLGTSDQLLTPEKKQSLSGNMDPGCMLRLFAYTWGPDRTLEYFFSRNKGVDKMHQRWLKTLTNDLITRQAVSVALDSRNIYKEECRGVLDLARQHWQMPEEEVGSVEDEMRRKFLHETVTLLDYRLRRADKLRAEKEMTRAQALAEVQL